MPLWFSRIPIYYLHQSRDDRENSLHFRKSRRKNLIDVIRDKNLVKQKGTKRRDRHKILWMESKKTEPKSVPTGKLCGSRLLEIKQKGKLDDRMRCRRDSVLKLPHPHLQLPWLEAVRGWELDWVVSKVEMQWNMSFVQA